MENVSRVYAGAKRAAGPLDCVTQLPEDWRLATAAHSELLHLGKPRLNLHLIGNDRVIWNVLEALLPEMGQPVLSWSPGRRLDLPPTPGGTLILHEIGAMPAEYQLRLLDWLEGAWGTTQVVSTSTAPLLTRIQTGAFVDMLYYRLNTVCVDVTLFE
jgi:Sigma-54 interaction domain